MAKPLSATGVYQDIVKRYTRETSIADDCGWQIWHDGDDQQRTPRSLYHGWHAHAAALVDRLQDRLGDGHHLHAVVPIWQ